MLLLHIIFRAMKKLILLLSAVPFVVMAQSQDDSIFIKKISDEMLRNGKAYEQLRELTKTIGGRLAGSPQFAKAVQWGKKTFQNVGADNVFLQECMVPHWVRGGADKVTIVEVKNKKENRSLDALALGNSLGSGTKGVTAEVLAVADFDELERRRDEVKGKIVYYNYAFNPTYLIPAQAYGETGAYRRSGPSRAAKYGAAGVLIRSLSGSTDNNPHTGSTLYDEAFPKIPCAALGLKDADLLYDLSKNTPVKVSIVTNGKMLPDTIGHNVVAELKGSEFPDQYITIGGHLDSWDVNEGAHDDGTGVVQTIEILRTLKALGYQPKHTIRFVLFANEENGLRGATKYADEAKAKNEQHVFALESDEGGFTPRGISFGMSNERLQKIQPWVKLLQPYGVHELTAGGGGTDVGLLQKNLGTPVGELRPDNQRYFDVHHSRADVFEAVNKRELLLGAVNMAALVYLVDKYGL
jgi:hypothetical protein